MGEKMCFACFWWQEIQCWDVDGGYVGRFEGAVTNCLDGDGIWIWPFVAEIGGIDGKEVICGS
jgi:hypothetical protein